MNMLRLVSPGDVFYGYCNGYFGRDSYNTKTCVAVRPKYAVFEYEDGTATLLHYTRDLTKAKVDEWKTRDAQEDEE